MTIEVWYQDLHRDFGGKSADGFDRLHPVLCSEVW